MDWEAWLAMYSPWGRKESDTTEQLSTAHLSIKNHFQIFRIGLHTDLLPFTNSISYSIKSFCYF